MQGWVDGERATCIHMYACTPQHAQGEQDGMLLELICAYMRALSDICRRQSLVLRLSCGCSCILQGTAVLFGVHQSLWSW